MKFKKSDRVMRKEDVYGENSKYLRGEVIEIYSEPQTVHCAGDLILGPYPELYKVKWDNGTIRGGYLLHGIHKEKEMSKCAN